MIDTGRLLRAAAANHRAWFRRTAKVAGGGVWRSDGLEVILADDAGTIAFPPARARSRDALDQAMRLEVRTMSCWSLAEDRTLGALLVARGFAWGWQPHWMALDLAQLPDDEPAHRVVLARGEPPRDVPYASGRTSPPAARHLAVVEHDRVVGHVVVNPWRGCAGIYDMGVAPDRRRRGIGRSLTLAACRVGRELGCSFAVLNATGEGEPLYRRLGFASLGLGRTWWLHAGPRPTRRQTALAEAIGLGDPDRLAALRPTRQELERDIPGGGPPLAIAVVTSRPDVADWILQQCPDLVSRPIEPRGGTLLHLAVECDDEQLVDVALAHGANRQARDHTWKATPRDWAQHLSRPKLVARLRD